MCPLTRQIFLRFNNNMGSNGPAPAVKQTSLAIIDYEALANGEAAEKAKLVQAAQKEGMFYLNLRGSRTGSVLEDIPAFFQSGNQFFRLPADAEEKTAALREGVERGYHRNKAAEYYEIPRDELQLGKWNLPATLESEKPRITRLLTSLNTAAQKILGELCSEIGIEIPELNDDPTIPSDTALKLLFKPAVHEVGQVVIGRHTDFGLLTFLWYDEVTTQLPVYNDQGGESGEWMEVPVIEGTMLVNVADGLQQASGGRLHSTVHRVVCPPGPKRTKNGLIYLLRPYKS